MLKIKDDVDFEILKHYGFKEFDDRLVRDYKNDYLTLIDKNTREILKVDYEYSFLENKYYENSTYKINDLIKDELVEKVSDD